MKPGQPSPNGAADPPKEGLSGVSGKVSTHPCISTTEQVDHDGVRDLASVQSLVKVAHAHYLMGKM